MATIRIADVIEGIEKYPEDMYLQYQKALGSPEGKDLRVSVLLDCLHEAFLNCGIKKEHWECFGNVVLRISHWMGDMDGDSPTSLDMEDEADDVTHLMNVFFNIYEDYNRRASLALSGVGGIKDGQHKFKGFRWDK